MLSGPLQRWAEVGTGTQEAGAPRVGLPQSLGAVAFGGVVWVTSGGRPRSAGER